MGQPAQPSAPRDTLGSLDPLQEGTGNFPRARPAGLVLPVEDQGPGGVWGSIIIFSEPGFCGAVRESRTWDGPPAISVPYTRSTKFTCFLCHYKMKQPFSSATQTPAGPDNWRTPEMACLPLWPSLQGAKFDSFLRHYYMV